VDKAFTRVHTKDYIEKLTDLSTLTALHINSWNAPLHYESRIPFQRIDPDLFSNAGKLQRISADRLSEDVVELILRHVDRQNPTLPTLSEIRIPRFWETQEIEGYADGDENYARGDPLFSCARDSLASYRWKKLTIGSRVKGGNHHLIHKMLKYMCDCVELEELVLPLLPNDEWLEENFTETCQFTRFDNDGGTKRSSNQC
jgi:hypothetical protein